MTERILIDVQEVVGVADGDDLYTRVDQVWTALRNLADELNSCIPDYAVELVHLDTGDYLAFAKRDPSEGAYWADMEEERRHIGQVLHENGDGDPDG